MVTWLPRGPLGADPVALQGLDQRGLYLPRFGGPEPRSGSLPLRPAGRPSPSPWCPHLLPGGLALALNALLAALAPSVSLVNLLCLLLPRFPIAGWSVLR